MKIEEKFNKRDAKLIEVQSPSVTTGRHLALGISLAFHTLPGSDDPRALRMHLTPDEALHLAELLISAVRKARD